MQVIEHVHDLVHAYVFFKMSAASITYSFAVILLGTGVGS